MTARRRRDPRIPHEHGLEDVEVVVGGEPVAWRGLTPADELIIAANQDALDARRLMWGLDRDDWLLAAGELIRDGHGQVAAVVLTRWCDIAVSCRQYDTREPDPTGFLVLADLHHATGQHRRERAVLCGWLSYWPADRWRGDHTRARTLERLEAGCGPR